VARASALTEQEQLAALVRLSGRIEALIEQRDELAELFVAAGLPLELACDILGISRATWYRRRSVRQGDTRAVDPS